MKLKHQIAAGAALLLLLAGCSQDQTMGGGKDASTSAYTNETQEPAKATAPPSTPAPAPTADSQSAPTAPTPTNPPAPTPPATGSTGDHPQQ